MNSTHRPPSATRKPIWLLHWEQRPVILDLPNQSPSSGNQLYHFCSICNFINTNRSRRCGIGIHHSIPRFAVRCQPLSPSLFSDLSQGWTVQDVQSFLGLGAIEGGPFTAQGKSVLLLVFSCTQNKRAFSSLSWTEGNRTSIQKAKIKYECPLPSLSCPSIQTIAKLLSTSRLPMFMWLSAQGTENT